MTQRTKAMLSLGGVFLLGALCGALALGAFVRGEVRRAQRLNDRHGFSEYFADELELTRAQRDSLQGELDWFYAQIAGLRMAAAGEYHELLDSLDVRLATHLSAPQRERLRATEKRLRRRIAAPRPTALLDTSDTDVARPHTTAQAPDTSVRTPARTPTKSVTPPQSAAKNVAPIDSAADTSAVAADPGEELDRFRPSIRERLHLSDAQVIRINRIIGTTRRAIRRDLAELRGYPRLQLETASRRLREMDAQIVETLDAKQREAYAPIREQIAKGIRKRILKNIKARRSEKSKGDKSGRELGETR